VPWKYTWNINQLRLSFPVKTLWWLSSIPAPICRATRHPTSPATPVQHDELQGLRRPRSTAPLRKTTTSWNKRQQWQRECSQNGVRNPHPFWLHCHEKIIKKSPKSNQVQWKNWDHYRSWRQLEPELKVFILGSPSAKVHLRVKTSKNHSEWISWILTWQPKANVKILQCLGFGELVQKQIQNVTSWLLHLRSS